MRNFGCALRRGMKLVMQLQKAIGMGYAPLSEHILLFKKPLLKTVRDSGHIQFLIPHS